MSEHTPDVINLNFGESVRVGETQIVAPKQTKAQFHALALFYTLEHIATNKEATAECLRVQAFEAIYKVGKPFEEYLG